MSDKNRSAIQNLWLVSYADFMTILMIFFLCMYGYSALAKAAAAKIRMGQVDQFSDMVTSLKKDLGHSISIEDSAGKTVVQLQSEIFFNSGEAFLKESPVAFDRLVSVIAQSNGLVIVQGHTDNRPIVGGRYRSNWELSAARAFSVIEALKNKGIPESRLSAWGFGEHRPVASNSDELGRQKNRRIEIVLLKGDSGVR